jgi:hypothetical protein
VEFYGAVHFLKARLRVGSRDRYIVEQAEASGPRRFGMVSGRPYNCKSAAGKTLNHRFHGNDGRACRHLDGLDTTRGYGGGIHIQPGTLITQGKDVIQERPVRTRLNSSTPVEVAMQGHTVFQAYGQQQ